MPGLVPAQVPEGNGHDPFEDVSRIKVSGSRCAGSIARLHHQWEAFMAVELIAALGIVVAVWLGASMTSAVLARRVRRKKSSRQEPARVLDRNVTNRIGQHSGAELI